MLVDDNELLARITTTILGQAGHRVSYVSSAFQFYGGLRTSRPDIVLVDYDMPGLRGDQLIERVRKSGVREPMVLYSSAPEDTLRRAVVRCGANGFLAKASDPETLLARFADLLRDLGIGIR
jgi:two-component system NtrC family sensor kinase